MTYMYISKWEPDSEPDKNGKSGFATILASTLGNEKPHIGSEFRFNLSALPPLIPHIYWKVSC